MIRVSTRQHQQLYQAFLRKDQQAAGRAFIAVRTTGIYCLLTCRARTPRPENVAFFRSRHAAERAGFRPCRKCRPEVQGGKAALEKLAMRNWLAKISEEETGIAELARRAGASPSRVYRLFRRNTGRGPVHARAEARLARACALLRQKHSTITEVAYAAGFSSLATFYRWFRRGTGKTPTQFRAWKAAAAHRTAEN
jgi:methylphosphotriester-DNA--protein-cysteine methyltransferase